MLVRLLLVVVVAAVGFVVQAQEPTAADKILELFREEFVNITPGKGMFPASFAMGSKDGPGEEKPLHDVKFGYSFAIAKYEVTQELYQVVAGGNPSKWKGPRNSVEMVSWDEANDFCQKVTDMLRKSGLIDKNAVVRLPSEAEWEYCCRAGTTTAYSYGDDVQKLGEFCWFTGNAKGNDPPVGAKKGNPWGLYDMHGYIWEWCADTWHGTYDNAPVDGSAWRQGDLKQRVLRGGSWEEKADACRSASRTHRPTQTRTPGIGFRCILATAAG